MHKVATQFFASILLVLMTSGGQAVADNILGQASPNDLKTAQASGIVVIDIRLEEEWLSTGIIEGAETITAFMANGQIHPEFLSKFQTVIPTQDTAVMLYCRTGNRTTTLGNALIQQLGYTHVSHLSHGITGWLGTGQDTTPYQP